MKRIFHFLAPGAKLTATPTNETTLPFKRSKSKRMVFLTTGLSLFLLGSPGLLSQENPPLKVDLDGDGTMEQIESKQTSSNDFGDFYQLVVRNAGKKIIWSSPVTKDPDLEFAFGSWDFGASLPQIAGDIDGDGAVELVVPSPQSDVSPASFRIFRWENDAFTYDFTKGLAGPGKVGGKITWTNRPRNTDFWVQEWIRQADNGNWVVRLLNYDWDSGSDPQEGTAEIAPKGTSYQLVRWVKAPAAFGEPPEVAEPQPMPPKTNPGGALVYQARLSPKDHVNSLGVKLESVSDILRQDRANFHKAMHADEEDQADSRFSTTKAREVMSGMDVVVAGGKNAQAIIMRGTPLVEVTVDGGTLRVQILEE